MRPTSTIAMVAVATLIPATIYAQSPPPAQLAPGSSGSAIAPQSQAPSPQPRSSTPARPPAETRCKLQRHRPRRPRPARRPPARLLRAGNGTRFPILNPEKINGYRTETS
jgi:hypothetical protein